MVLISIDATEFSKLQDEVDKLREEVHKLKEFKLFVVEHLKLYKPVTQITNGILDFHQKELMTYTCYCDKIATTNIINLRTDNGGRSGQIKNSSNINVTIVSCKSHKFSGIMTCLIKINDNLDPEIYYPIMKYGRGKWIFSELPVVASLYIHTVEPSF